MKIIYVGKHNNPRSNDDEGGITCALLELGHEVHRVQENKLSNGIGSGGDILLFNHYQSPQEFAQFNIPKVFWCFDRIEWDDPSLTSRNLTRTAWLERATSVADIGFCTDGDAVAKDRTGKLHWLTQGFNTHLPTVPPLPESERSGILFTGGGREYGRNSFVGEMGERYPTFKHVSKGAYQAVLSQLIGTSAIVVAPDSPITHQYWSNRVYVTLGMGGFLLHPYCQELTKHYRPGFELQYYHSRRELHELIEFYSKDIDNRETMRCAGQYKTLQAHTYKHRCESLITAVKEKLGL